MPTVPLDYATRHTLTLIEKKRVSKALSNADALALVKAIVPADAPGPQDVSATEVFMQAIADVQKAQPQLAFVAASDQVRKSFPELYDGYLHESCYPHMRGVPLAKAAPALTPEAVLKTARADATTNGTSCRTELLALCKAHEGTPHFGAVAEAWRRYHVSAEGVDDQYAERLKG